MNKKTKWNGTYCGEIVIAGFTGNATKIQEYLKKTFSIKSADKYMTDSKEEKFNLEVADEVIAHIETYPNETRKDLFVKPEYNKQENVHISVAEFGIKRYTKDQKELHTDVMTLMKSKKYAEIPADDCMVVFGRVYAIYVATQMKKDGFKFGDEK